MSLRSGLLHPVCLHSTNQHLTEEFIYKPSASGAITDWYPECFGPSQLYVLKAIGRSQDSCPFKKKKGGGRLCSGIEVWCGKRFFERFNLKDTSLCCTRASIFFQWHIMLWEKGKRGLHSPSHCLENREPADKKWQRHFWEGKVRGDFFPLRLIYFLVL